MTSTAEERAKDLANRLDGASPREWNRLIAQAIRSAENDKLEEVRALLQRLEDHFDTMTGTGAAIISGALAEFKDRLRSLTKD